MCTVDVLSSQGIQYTTCLNAKGRILTDCFMYKLNENHVLLEIPGATQETCPIIRHFKKYCVKVSVHFDNVSDLFKVYTSQSMNKPKNTLSFGPDPRNASLGYRFLVHKKDFGKEYSENNVYDDEIDLKKRRIKLGIMDGYDYNLEVDFAKGCYLGQESVTRIEHQGVVRSRTMSTQISKNNIEDRRIVLDSDSVAVKQRGVLMSHFGNTAFTLMNLNVARSNNLVLKCDHTIKFRPFIPEWWPENVKNSNSQEIN
ncbi:Aminomethyltransferase folate-binding domain-containing protein [Rozella allomycis CSF55]|uniref:Aminomethyltransferase folate-binding domain-containing protein n=1 Tax=Rozella allomycis (strain CSF55) TaxID=988480 RepID=A0A075ATX5_ROZAC|nr:hypothetical protein O9G_000350 [Rozella allomycis CSF55]RKP20270.1 Aminomethyltransferase folate-binding domain-containing protein [Rozella allomycis CSF55]|eukprot:EPZ33575.1 hypothetical protein O9G_000350 [Rozella allomycis CSF55]